jgi:tetratricopeptide (TPR) repeat protein
VAKVQTLTPREKAERLFSQAQAALANGDDRLAASLLERTLAEDARHDAARKQLGMLMIREGRRAPAESLLADGLQLSPRDSELAKAYAQLLVERGELPAALNALERFAEGVDEDADSLALRAGILDRLQRYGESVTAYRRALHLQPARAVWWTGLGLALEHDGQSAAALAAYRRAARLPAGESVRNFVLQRVRVLESPANRG